MKSFILLLAILVFSIPVQAQVLTQAFNEPKPGDKEYYYNLDTAVFTMGLPTNTGGSATWDFRTLMAKNPLNTIRYMHPDSVADSNNFPGCTVVRVGSFNTFIRSAPSTSETELLGVNATTLTLNLTNTGIIARYPMQLGSTVTDNMAGTFSGLGISGNCTGKVTTTVDGAGTLLLPQNVTLTNILRLKSVQTLTLTQGIFPVATIKQILINFYDASVKFPVLSLNYQVIAPLTGSTITTASVDGNNSVFITGLETRDHVTRMRLYPNPSNGIINIDIEQALSPGTITLRTITGELVYEGPYLSRLTVPDLRTGLYLVEVTTNRGTAHEIVIVE